MRYEKDVKVKFTNVLGKVVHGVIISRTMEGRKTICIQVQDEQNKVWSIPSAKDLERV